MFLGYVVLSAISILFWHLNISCGSPGACSDSFPICSLFLWGALFYAVAGFLCFLPKNRGTCAFLTTGAVFHAGLIAYGRLSLGYSCPVCLGFAFFGVGFAFAYWRSFSRERSWAAGTALFVVPALALAALVLLNPQGGKSLFAGEEGGGGKACIKENESAVEEFVLAASPGAKAANVSQAEPSTGTERKARPEITIPLPFSTSQDSLWATAPDGREVCLDLRSRPALLFAVWCPHCDAALREVAKKGPEERPYLVVTYLRDGDAEKVKNKLAENGLAGELYYLAEKPPAGVQGVPALVGRNGEP